MASLYHGGYRPERTLKLTRWLMRSHVQQIRSSVPQSNNTLERTGETPVAQPERSATVRGAARNCHDPNRADPQRESDVNGS